MRSVVLMRFLVCLRVLHLTSSPQTNDCFYAFHLTPYAQASLAVDSSLKLGRFDTAADSCCVVPSAHRLVGCTLCSAGTAMHPDIAEIAQRALGRLGCARARTDLADQLS